jgi:hypothetical protein
MLRSFLVGQYDLPMMTIRSMSLNGSFHMFSIIRIRFERHAAGTLPKKLFDHLAPTNEIVVVVVSFLIDFFICISPSSQLSFQIVRIHIEFEYDRT